MQQYGNFESGRVDQILAQAKLSAMKTAIAKARASGCCGPPVRFNGQVPPTSTALQGKMDSCSQTTSDQATAIASQNLRGVSQSVRIKNLQQQTNDAYAPYNANINLYNSNGLPAVPFRTDSTTNLSSTQSGLE